MQAKVDSETITGERPRSAPVRNVVVNAAHDALAEVLRVTGIDPLADKISTARAVVRAR